MQTKKESLREAVTSTGVGFIISLLVQFIITTPFTYYAVAEYGTTGALVSSIVITLYMTKLSVLRQYLVRRWFNGRIAKREETKQREMIYA